MTDYQFFDPEILIRSFRNLGITIDHASASQMNEEKAVFLLTGGLISDGKTRKTLFGFLKLISVYFKAERFLKKAESYSDEELKSISIDEKKVMSVTLGLCAQTLMARLPAHGDEDLAGWLLKKDALSAKLAAPLRKLEKIQILRAKISDIWNEIEGESRLESQQIGLTAWKGFPVYSGKITGQAVFVKDLKSSNKDELVGKILIFKNATPKTVEFFQDATAVLFCEGGLLSHACVMAREYRKPAITALGRGFLKLIEEQNTLALAIDGETGEVKLMR